MDAKLDLALLLSVNHSVVLATERDGGVSRPITHAFHAQLIPSASGSSEEDDEREPSTERKGPPPPPSTVTVENVKRLRALRVGILPSLWRKTRERVFLPRGNYEP